ncbi:chorismate mutase [Caldalkalibacillus mannanilyticus]|uniref:chorismate mutase n=1 Tax=Caldalkalibacillus mannanilyticus TaxID=1418 RepID=UPI0004686D3E|nr:chorismate mutase [Caldalkalibacillus mannanilyticus]
MTLRVRGIRGAVTVEKDQAEEVVQTTETLLREMIQANQLEAEDVASIWITATEDIVSAFPAQAIRNIEGWSMVPVLCAREIPVPQSLAMCIRIMLHVNTTLRQDEINHVYLKGAKQLRPDLNLTQKRS